MWKSIFLCAVAFSLGWAIRGTILGGPKGAMLPGTMIGLAMAKISGWQGYDLHIILAAAGAIGFSFGGEMTYGETLGMTQDSEPPSNYWWGILGTAVKGSVWIGLGSLLVGMATGNVSYSLIEWIVLAVVFLFTMELGIKIFNKPLNPPTTYPRIYFSISRQESWGGMWLSYIVLVLYAWLIRNDYVAALLSLVGLLGGVLGFPIGQMLQSWGKRKKPFGDKAQKWIDWWKVMEFSFGAIAGAVLGWGWWHIHSVITNISDGALDRALSTSSQWITLIIYGVIFVLMELFNDIDFKPHYITHHFIPLVFILNGNTLWCYFVIGPILIWLTVKKIIQNYYGDNSIPKFYILVLITLWIAWAAILLRGYIAPDILWTLILLLHVIASGIHLWKAKIKGKEKPGLFKIPVFILMLLQMICLFIIY